MYKDGLFYRPSISVTVRLLVLGFFPLEDVSVSMKETSVTKPGTLGSGTVEFSLPSMNKTDNMVGLSSTRCCTHKRPTLTHLITSFTENDPSIGLSISSKGFPSFHSFQA